MKKSFLKKTTSFLVILLFLYAPFFQIHTAHALDFDQFADVINFGGEIDEEIILQGVAGCAANAAAVWGIAQVPFLEGTKVGTADSQSNFKENFFDCIIYVGLKALIQTITQTMIEWAQGGFDGNPAFVQNLNLHLERAANEEINILINDINEEAAGLLCNPRPILNAVITQYQADDFRSRVACTLDEAVANVEAFYEGDFSQGGWTGWLEFTQSNSYTEFSQVQSELDSRIAARIDSERELLDWGKGFFSWQTQDCYLYPQDGIGPPQPYDPDEAPEGPPPGKVECDPPVNNTPGSVIETSINDTLLSGRRQLELANEINEMISALIAYLIQDVITGEEGLAGYDPEDFGRDKRILPPEITPPDLTGGGGPNPSGGTPGEEMTITDPGFTVSQESPIKRIPISIPDGVIYDRAVIEFDVFVDNFVTNFNSIAHMTNPGIRGRYFSTFVREMPDNPQERKTSVDVKDGSNNNFTRPWQEGANYHVTINYSTFEGWMEVEVENLDTGEIMAPVGAPVDRNDIRAFEGQGPVVEFGLDRPRDNAFFPPYGWEFSNISINLTALDLDLGPRPNPNDTF